MDFNALDVPAVTVQPSHAGNMCSFATTSVSNRTFFIEGYSHFGPKQSWDYKTQCDVQPSSVAKFRELYAHLQVQPNVLAFQANKPL